MDYRYLKAFLYTVRWKSFSKAAQDLNVAQSAISRQIKLLEESVGKQLLIRSSKKVILTDEGHTLFNAVEHFDQKIHQLFIQDENRVIRIGILHGLMENWFQSILANYYHNHTNNMDISILGLAQLHEGLKNGELDIIFTTENIQSDIISSLRLFEERLSLISKGPVDIKGLESYRWIIYDEDDQIFKVAKRKVPKHMIKVNSITSIIGLVSRGLGIAVVPEHLLAQRSDLHQIPLAKLRRSEIYMATLNFQKGPAFIKNLHRSIKNYNDLSPQTTSTEHQDNDS